MEKQPAEHDGQGAAELEYLDKKENCVVDDEGDQHQGALDERVAPHRPLVEKPDKRAGHRGGERVLPEQRGRVQVEAQAQEKPDKDAGHHAVLDGEEKEGDNGQVRPYPGNGNNRHERRLQHEREREHNEPLDCVRHHRGFSRESSSSLNAAHWGGSLITNTSSMRSRVTSSLTNAFLKIGSRPSSSFVTVPASRPLG